MDDNDYTGLTFDLLLLSVWPYVRQGISCTRCGKDEVIARGLCSACYQSHRDEGHLLGRGSLTVEDIERAERIGVSYWTLLDWRQGKHLPRHGYIDEIAGRLEAEFQIPKEVWLDAWKVSYRPRERTLTTRCKAGHIRVGPRGPGHQCAECQALPPWRPREPRPVSFRPQYGWWRVVSEAPALPVKRTGGWYKRLNVVCLLCNEQSIRFFASLAQGRSSSCQSCAGKLRLVRPGGLGPGVSLVGSTWRIQFTVRGRIVRGGRFRTAEHAARWADEITYKAYGHTIFLNFPEEYDQSNDPVFVPAGGE